jgi:hypothetical protein
VHRFHISRLGVDERTDRRLLALRGGALTYFALSQTVLIHTAGSTWGGVMETVILWVCIAVALLLWLALMGGAAAFYFWVREERANPANRLLGRRE